jgi:hypothetical protein
MKKNQCARYKLAKWRKVSKSVFARRYVGQGLKTFGEAVFWGRRELENFVVASLNHTPNL